MPQYPATMIKKVRRILKWLLIAVLLGSLSVMVGLERRFYHVTKTERGGGSRFTTSSTSTSPTFSSSSLFSDVVSDTERKSSVNSFPSTEKAKSQKLEVEDSTKTPNSKILISPPIQETTEKLDHNSQIRRRSSLTLTTTSVSEIAAEENGNKKRNVALLRNPPQRPVAVAKSSSKTSSSNNENSNFYVPRRRKINSVKPNQKTPANDAATVTTTEPEMRGFVTALEFWDQQTYSIQNILSLQAWAGSRGLRVLEPFLIGTKFGLPLTDHESFHANGSVSYLAMSDVYDLDQWNTECNMYHRQLSPLTPWREFLNSAPRDVKFIFFDTWISNRKLHDVKLFNSTLKKLGFRLVSEQDIKLRYKKLFTDVDLESEVYNGTSKSELTVVFSCWNRMDLPRVAMGMSFNMLVGSFVVSLKPSRRLVEDAKRYQKHNMPQNRSYIGVLIRSEWLIMNRGYPEVRKGILQECINRAVGWLLAVRNTTGISGAFVGMDIGRYGSTTLKDLQMDYVKELGEKFLKFSYNDSQMTLESWENTFTDFGSSSVPGYVAFLQKYLAVHGRCLLLVGTGSFQNHALQMYTQLHPPGNQCYLRTDAQCKIKTRKGLDIP